MRCVRHRHDHRQLGPQLDERAGVGTVAHVGQRAVGLDGDALEEVHAGNEVATAQSVLGQRHREAVARVRVLTVHATVAVPLLVAQAVRRAAEGVVRRAVGGGDRQEDATHVGEEERAGAEVRLPLHLDRVGHVQPFERLRRVVDEHVGARVAVEVGEPERGAAGQHP